MAYIIDSNQYLFEKALKGLWIAFKIILNLVTYLPLGFTGYLITSLFLKKNDEGFTWIGLLILFTFLAYQAVYFVKGLLIGLKNKSNLLWVPLFIICISFTCLFPALFIHNNIRPWLHTISPNSGNLMAWLTSILMGIYVYSRYHFLTNIAPMAALFAYQFGMNLVSSSRPKII